MTVTIGFNLEKSTGVKMKIALYRGTGFISTGIKWQTRGPYSHAAIILPNNAVIESKEFIGVHQVPLEVKDFGAAKGVAVEVYEVDTTDAEDAVIEAFLRSQLGKPYDYSMVFRFVTRQGMDAHSKGKWFCSELVFAAFQQAGINLFERTEAWEVSPSMLGRSPLLKPILTETPVAT